MSTPQTRSRPLETWEDIIDDLRRRGKITHKEAEKLTECITNAMDNAYMAGSCSTD